MKMKCYLSLIVILTFTTTVMASNKIVSQEDTELIQSIYTEEVILKEPEQRRPIESVVCSVETYINEIGSGEDFIQYFNWSNDKEIEVLKANLVKIEALKSLEICKKSISIAFPKGIPADSTEYEDYLYDLEFEDEHENIRKSLSELALKQLDELYELETNLATFIRKEN